MSSLERQYPSPPLPPPPPDTLSSSSSGTKYYHTIHQPLPPPSYFHPSSPSGATAAAAAIIELQGRSLLAPYSSFSRAVMGNETSAPAPNHENNNKQQPSSSSNNKPQQQQPGISLSPRASPPTHRKPSLPVSPSSSPRSRHQQQPPQQQQQQRPMSNLSVLLYQQEQQQQQRQHGGGGSSSSSPAAATAAVDVQQPSSASLHPKSSSSLQYRQEFVVNPRPLPLAHQQQHHQHHHAKHDSDEADSASGPTNRPSLFATATSAPSDMLHPSQYYHNHHRIPTTTTAFTGQQPQQQQQQFFYPRNNSANLGRLLRATTTTTTDVGGGAGNNDINNNGMSRMHASMGQVNFLLPERVRRCMSSKELKTLAPPSGSPYEYMLHKKEELEASTRQRLQEIKLLTSAAATSSDEQTPTPPPSVVVAAASNTNTDNADISTTSSSAARRRAAAGANESRNRKRSMHNQAVVNDLCDIVADLFIAESKLLKPMQYGVPAGVLTAAADNNNSSSATTASVRQRQEISRSIHNFVSALPLRYALSADTPSEVLLHMRLMAAARSDRNKAVVHIHNLQDEHDNEWVCRQTAAAMGSSSTITRQHYSKSLRLVTISCHDAVGLLELITKALATGGSSVLDADVMLSTDGIVLDRFVVEMNGRLRLDKLAQLIESHLKQFNGSAAAENASSTTNKNSTSAGAMGEPKAATTHAGPIYFKEQESPKARGVLTPREIQREMETAVPLSEVLASNSSRLMIPPPELPRLRKMHSMPTQFPQQEQTPNGNLSTVDGDVAASCLFPLPSTRLVMRPSFESMDGGVSIQQSPPHYGQQQPPPQNQTVLSNNDPYPSGEPPPATVAPMGGAGRRHPRRPLVNRRGSSDLDQFGSSPKTSSGVVDGSGLEEEEHSLDYVTVPSSVQYDSSGAGAEVETRVVPLIPFDELMLIETIGTGRVSTIYRAAWQHGAVGREHLSSVHMVALKVAMVNPETGDPSHVDELRREADIAARLQHPNIADLVGVAADAECFCLAYDFCEGGSLLSLLSDSKRYYEYLPIALDIANGMAYLHSRNVIHRDLKPSNILLTRDHRAKIADFGMSVANTGQELTAETGTYRYMAPEVIRHESYSSNADVYSFGLCLWQLITREVPFATMTPIQAAYAVAEGRRPEIPASTPRRLQEIIFACWEQESHRRPSFTYIAMALADYAKMAFSPANVGALTLQIANEMLANVNGNSTVNVDFTTPVTMTPPSTYPLLLPGGGGGVFVDMEYNSSGDSINSDIGLQI